jgi:hypothetical protein
MHRAEERQRFTTERPATWRMQTLERVPAATCAKLMAVFFTP